MAPRGTVTWLPATRPTHRISAVNFSVGGCEVVAKEEKKGGKRKMNQPPFSRGFYDFAQYAFCLGVLCRDGSQASPSLTAVGPLARPCLGFAHQRAEASFRLSFQSCTTRESSDARSLIRAAWQGLPHGALKTGRRNQAPVDALLFFQRRGEIPERWQRSLAGGEVDTEDASLAISRLMLLEVPSRRPRIRDRAGDGAARCVDAVEDTMAATKAVNFAAHIPDTRSLVRPGVEVAGDAAAFAE